MVSKAMGVGGPKVARGMIKRRSGMD